LLYKCVRVFEKTGRVIKMAKAAKIYDEMIVSAIVRESSSSKVNEGLLKKYADAWRAVHGLKTTKAEEERLRAELRMFFHSLQEYDLYNIPYESVSEEEFEEGFKEFMFRTEVSEEKSSYEEDSFTLPIFLQDFLYEKKECNSKIDYSVMKARLISELYIEAHKEKPDMDMVVNYLKRIYLIQVNKYPNRYYNFNDEVAPMLTALCQP